MIGSGDEPGLFAFLRGMHRISQRLYDFREEAHFAYLALLCLGFAGLTGIAAQLTIPLPFTPVPVTGQVFAVLVAAGILGRWLGWISQAAYVGLGAFGVPWFAPHPGQPWFSDGGIRILLGPTGGYLIGFVVASALVGWLLDRGFGRKTFAATLCAFLAGVGTIYAVGVPWLAQVAHLDLGTSALLGLVPFVPGDVLKAVLAAALMIGFVPSSRERPSHWSQPWLVPIRLRDLLAAGLALGAIWILAAWILVANPGVGVIVAVDGTSAPAELRLWYLIAAGVATATALVALGSRWMIARVLSERVAALGAT